MLYNDYECWECGATIKLTPEPTSRVYCKGCQKLHRTNHNELILEYSLLKIKVMYENALRIMEKSGMYMHEYLAASQEILNQALNDTEKYYSAHEMITGIILTEFGYEFIPNYKIMQYKVDFYLPDIKCCLEVDGHLHNGKEFYDSGRDIDIRSELGAEWEVVRIKTKYIEKYPPKIPDAVEALLLEKKKIRSQHGGVIPEWYSKRERKHYEKIGEYRTKKVRKI